jgi:putative ABC transport system permease protein
VLTLGKNLYIKLATTNIKKGKDINLPYMIAITIIVATFYLVVAMLHNKGLKDIPNSGALVRCFQTANYIIGIIAFIFMIYINSFLIKKRLKEFGLYNILGLEKKHIIYVMIIENFIIFGVAILCGLILGTVLGKLIFMILLKVCHTTNSSTFLLSVEAYLQSFKLFGIIFIICSILNVITILRNKTIDLLHSDKYGEKKMKGMLFFTIVGLILMAVAYYVANTTKNYVQAIQIFFPTVIMVIIATYLLFITGSIVLLNILKKNKKFYYKANNFISTSSLIYRMKQNAVGLANICILSTMVIVTAAGCVSLYCGQETIIKQMNPSDLKIFQQADTISENMIREVANKHNISISNYMEFNSIHGAFIVDGSSAKKMNEIDFSNTNLDNLYDFVAMSADEYNRAFGTDIHVESGHIVIASLNDLSMFANGMDAAGKMYQVDDILKDTPLLDCKNSKVDHTICIVFANDDEAVAFTNWIYYNPHDPGISIASSQFIDYEGKNNDRLLFSQEIAAMSSQKSLFQSIDTQRVEAYGTYGGILFIGVFFIIIFITITILIIYFKQVTEGFDDRERFVILQKVGMDEKMVKQAINRQIIIVFFLPLITALIHLLAASNIIKSMMTAFYLVDIALILKCIVATSAVFAVVYIVVFKVTAKTYYRIVKF